MSVIGVRKAQALIERLGGALDPLVPGYRIKIIDGNHLASTDRRLDVLRSQGSAPLPGHALVILDPRLQLAIEVFACEDGHAQERALLGRVLATGVRGDLWIANRNFCTLGFLGGLHSRAACFVIRQHGNLPWSPLSELETQGDSDTGSVFEQTVQVVIVWRPKLMFLDITQGAVASTLPVGTDLLPDHQYETVRHLLFGSLTAVRMKSWPF